MADAISNPLVAWPKPLGPEQLQGVLTMPISFHEWWARAEQLEWPIQGRCQCRQAAKCDHPTQSPKRVTMTTLDHMGAGGHAAWLRQMHGTGLPTGLACSGLLRKWNMGGAGSFKLLAPEWVLTVCSPHALGVHPYCATDVRLTNAERVNLVVALAWGSVFNRTAEVQSWLGALDAPAHVPEACMAAARMVDRWHTLTTLNPGFLLAPSIAQLFYTYAKQYNFLGLDNGVRYV